MSCFTRTLIIAARRGLGSTLGIFKEQILTLTEGYLEIRISIKGTVTLMTNIHTYIVYISISLHHL